jgi:lysophospholipase L1-like esterase
MQLHHLLFAVSLAALCAASAGAAPLNPVLQPINDVAGLPRMLIIGDSISMGYTLPVRELLKDKMNVHRIPENGGPTSRGVQQMDKWLGTGKWDVITFNFGLHDLKRMDTGLQQVPPADYEKNLRTIVAKLKATGAKLIWVNTTPVPEGDLNPPRHFDDAVKYNDIAARVMKDNGVTILDLYAFALPQLAQIQNPHDVHFKPEGYKALAAQLVAAVQAALNPPAAQ